jgi:hypothetical protein
MSSRRVHVLAAAILASAAIVFFVVALLPTTVRGTPIYDAARFAFAAVVLGAVGWLVWQGRRTAAIASPARAVKCYGVPERFGIGALLAMVLLFAIVSAVLRWSGAPPVVSAFVLTLLAFAALFQAFLAKPRTASVVAGALVFPGFFFFGQMMYAPRTLVGIVPSQVAFMTALCMLSGLLAGYVAGAIVASVFLVMDHMGLGDGQPLKH